MEVHEKGTRRTQKVYAKNREFYAKPERQAEETVPFNRFNQSFKVKIGKLNQPTELGNLSPWTCHQVPWPHWSQGSRAGDPSSKQYNSKAFAMAMSPSVTLDQSERRFAAPKDQPATGEVVLASVRVACDRRLSAHLLGNKLGLSLIDLPFRMEHLGNS